MKNWKKMLEDAYEEARHSLDHRMSRLVFLADHIFDFTTYEDEMAERLAIKAIETIIIITTRSTEHLENDESRMWYLIMVNMPFFQGRLEWGTSIRTAWWDNNQVLMDCGMLSGGREIGASISFAKEEWEDFLMALVMFGAEKNAPTILA